MSGAGSEPQDVSVTVLRELVAHLVPAKHQPPRPPPTTALLRWVGPEASLGWPNHLDPPELSQQMVLGAGTKGLALCWPDTLGVGPLPGGSN